MGLWATVKKVMESKFFSENLKNGNYEVQNSVNSTYASRAKLGQGKKFLFDNLGGFGISETKVDSYFYVWSHNTQGNDDYYCCLIPSNNGVQDLGNSSKSLYRVYSKKFITTDVDLPGDSFDSKKVPNNGLYYGEWSGNGERLCIGLFFWHANMNPIYIATGGSALTDTTYTTVIKASGYASLKRARNGSISDVTSSYTLFLRRM